MKKARLLATALLLPFLSMCASRSSDIAATYVSPLAYSNLNCRQIGQEAERVSARAAQVAGVQDSKATGDAVATGVGVVLFWPALFFIRGDSTTGAELGRLKGEMDAIERAAIEKRCNISFRRTS